MLPLVVSEFQCWLDTHCIPYRLRVEKSLIFKISLLKVIGSWKLAVSGVLGFPPYCPKGNWVNCALVCCEVNLSNQPAAAWLMAFLLFTVQLILCILLKCPDALTLGNNFQSMGSNPRTKDSDNHPGRHLEMSAMEVGWWTNKTSYQICSIDDQFYNSQLKEHWHRRVDIQVLTPFLPLNPATLLSCASVYLCIILCNTKLKYPWIHISPVWQSHTVNFQSGSKALLFLCRAWQKLKKRENMLDSLFSFYKLSCY